MAKGLGDRYARRADAASREWLGWPGFNFVWGHAAFGAVVGAMVGLAAGLIIGEPAAGFQAGVGGGVALLLLFALLAVLIAWVRRRTREG